MNFIRGGIAVIELPELELVNGQYLTQDGYAVKFRFCEDCGRLFVIRDERYPVRFCSNACKQRNYRQRKSLAKRKKL